MSDQSDPDDVPTWNAKDISKLLNKTERATFHILASGLLGDAVTKVGSQYVTTPRRIRSKLFGHRDGKDANG